MNALRLRFLRMEFLTYGRYTALRIVVDIHFTLDPFHTGICGNDVSIGRGEH